MIYNDEIYSAAEQNIAQRRQAATLEYDRRNASVAAEIPEIKEISDKLSQTGFELFKVITDGGSQLQERIARAKEANLTAQEMIRMILKAHGYVEDYLDYHYKCERCSDTGYYQGHRCECFTKEVARLSILRMNKKTQLKLSTFTDFSLKYYKGDSLERMTANFEYCRDYAKSFSLSSPSIFMLGKTGLGKTHLSLAIAESAINKCFHVAYDSIINYLLIIEKEHFGRIEGDTLSTLMQAELLILDDLGSEYDKPFYASTIYNIINTRLNRSLPTIISTNLSSEEMQRKYDDRIISRLYTMYDLLIFTGEDVRQQKKLEKSGFRGNN